MWNTFLRLYDLLNRKERHRALLLLGMMLVMGLLEAIGVASVMPFIAVVSTPQVIHENAYLNAAFNGLGFNSREVFLLFLGGAVFCLVVGSLAFKAFTEWNIARYVQMRNHALGCRLLRSYLQRPYIYFIDRHSADLGKSVLAEVQQVVNGALLPALQLFANAMVATLLFILIIRVGATIAFAAMAVLGGGYVFIYLFVRGHLRRIGNRRVRANRERYKIAQEALGGIKDLKVLGLEESYMKNFQGYSLEYARSQASNQIISQVPQFVLQGLAFGGILVLLLLLLFLEGGDIKGALPILSLYAFAGMRLLPALQMIYQSVTRLRYSAPILELLHGDFLKMNTVDISAAPICSDRSIIRLRREMKLDQVSYTYPQAERPALSALSFVIQARTTIGLVGPTGGGKTTIADIILGLLEPQEGSLLVDGVAIDRENLQAWRRSIGYVPQHIFLTDDTIVANIAFGVPHEDVDLRAVRHAAHIAGLHNFIVRDAPKGYETVIGERGVRLSGGQRQRIGIARALYHDPDILIFDEATSALDNFTERAVMEAVRNMAHHKTIVLIAHRLTTVRYCDVIFVLDNGRIKASGSYPELLKSSSDFRRIANG